MGKRLSSKVLALILTLAICATTVLGCLMTVSADTSCYSIGKGKFASKDDLSHATVDVIITAPESLPNGFLAGAFGIKEVGADAQDYLILDGINFKSEGVTYELTEDDYVIFETAKVSTLEFELTFSFSNGDASENKDYKVQLDEIELSYNQEEYFIQSAAGAIGKISVECEHVVSVVGDPIKVDTANNYSVYESSVCTLCGESFGYQLVPTAEKLGGEDADAGTTICWSADGAYDDVLADDASQTGDQNNPIIIDSVEELYSLAIRTDWEVSLGKYYKLADGIDKVVLQSETVANNILSLTSAEDVKTYFEANPGFVWGASRIDKKAFAGHFDGNGAVFYGLYSKNKEVSGLFPKTYYTDTNTNALVAEQNKKLLADGNISVSNVNITNSYICNTQGTVRMGFITGEALLTDNNQWTEYLAKTGIEGHYADWYLQVSECSLYNNYMYTSNSLANAVVCCGIISGAYNGFNKFGDIYSGARFVSVDNCLLYDNIGVTSSGTNIAMVGQYGRGDINGNNQILKNSIVLGTEPFYATGNGGASYSAHSGDAAHFKNVYSDALTPANMSAVYSNATVTYTTEQIAPITKSEVLSTDIIKKSNLAWGTTWLKDGADTYPRLALPGETSDTICWDGTNTKTAPTVGGGTKDNPYIISTVAELAYIFGQARDNYAITDGKYYKLADGIKNIVMQPYAYIHDVMALDSAADTKAYFEANGTNMKQWLHYGWESSTFCGDIDFNGATVYGIYQVSTDNAGLISNVDAGAVVRNVAVKNSYMTSSGLWNATHNRQDYYQVGAIAAVTNGSGYGKKANGFIWFNGCTVANNYMYNAVNNSNDRSGVILGASSDLVYIDNCLVYGNDATYGDGVTMPILSSANNSVLVSAAPTIPDGLTAVDDDGAETPRYNNMVRNSIILGAKPYDTAQGKGSRFNDPKCYEDVYTDSDVATDTFSGGVTLGATDDQIKTIDSDSILGAAAQSAMPGLTWGTDWYCGAYGKLPTLAAFTTLGVNKLSTGEHQLYASSVTYNDDGSYDFNLHFVPQYAGIKATLYVGTLDTTKFYKLEATESSYRDDLGENALMFTLPNMSARDINKVWLPTVVVDGGANVEWGKSAQIAVADNARAILEGDYDTADKNVSAALLNYGEKSDAALGITSIDYDAGQGDTLVFGDYLKEAGSSSIYWDTNVADNGETGTQDDPIIIDSAEEFVYLAKASGNETAGLYYKVADGMAAFDLSGGKVDPTKSLADNLSAIQSSGKNHSGGTPGFQGHLDGNGVTIYGAWTNDTWNESAGKYNTPDYAGLFSCTKGTVTIKNINVRLSYFSAKSAAGGLIGYYAGAGTGSLTIENCSVADCFIKTTGTGYGKGVGALVGYAHNYGSSTNGPITINNCYVNLDEEYFISQNEIGTQTDTTLDGAHGGLIGFAVTNYTNDNKGNITNCVVIGVTPYATTSCTGNADGTNNNNIQHSALETHFANVYTDQASGKVAVGGSTLGERNYTDRVFQLTKEQMTGSAAKDNMPGLNWDTTWTTTGGYPTFINKDYKAPSSGYAIYWDGTNTKTAPTVGGGTKDNPYIISTVAELAYIFGQARDNYTITDGKYYKLADGITSIVMQPESYAASIMALGSAAEVKAYFEANGANMKQWLHYGWEGSTFCGDIDFNGATVYGIYQVSTDNAGLISNVDAGAVVRNVAVKNSYMTSSGSWNATHNRQDYYQVGAIAAVTNGATYGKSTSGFIWFNGCTVANNYMYNAVNNSNDRSGVILGASSDLVYIDNCLVYGNDATYGDGVTMPILSSANNNVLVSAAPTIPDGLTAVDDGAATPRYNNMVRNSIILGAKPYDTAQGKGSRFNDPKCYEDVYTDSDVATDTFSGGVTLGATDDQITVISADKALGAEAKTNMPNLDWNIWYTGFTGDYPALKEAGSMPSIAQTLYNAMSLSNYDTVGSGAEYHANGSMSFGVYNASLNLKANPYMVFTFAFLGDYMKNRENIKIRFTYTENGATVVGDPIAVPAYTGEDIVGVDGWTHREDKNGRYHTYRATDLPVEALANGIKVEASYNGGAWKDFGSYSVEGFALLADNASKIEPCDYYATRYEAAKALLFYAKMLAARYGA